MDAGAQERVSAVVLVAVVLLAVMSLAVRVVNVPFTAWRWVAKRSVRPLVLLPSHAMRLDLKVLEIPAMSWTAFTMSGVMRP
jgi:hypothetical protein